MFNVWHGNIGYTALILIVSVVIVLPVQLLLCLKVRNFAIRLLPVIILSVFIGIFVIMVFSVRDLRVVGYLLLAVYAGIMMFFCGIGWGIWAITYKIKNRDA